MQKDQLGRREILTRLLPGTGSFLPECHTTPVNAPLTHCRAAVTPWAQFSIKPALSWFLAIFSVQRSTEKLEKELSPKQAHKPQHTHTCAQLSAVSSLWESVRHKCGLGAAVMEVKTAALSELIQWQKRKKRRQTQVFNKTFINDFPGRTLALAQREQQSWDCSELEKFILSTKHYKEQPSKAQCFPPPEVVIEQQGFEIS